MPKIVHIWQSLEDVQARYWFNQGVLVMGHHVLRLLERIEIQLVHKILQIMVHIHARILVGNV